jgi:serine/threonine protein kinase
MNCPDHEQLVAFLRGEGPSDLSAHVESCPHCQKALAELGTLDEAAVRQAAQLPAVPPTTAEPPRTLGAYQLLRRLGAPSGQGEVWLARHIIIGFLSAIKVLRPDRTGREALERFRREMQLYGQLEHPNIVGVRHAEEIDGQPILVMPYIDGLSLHELAQRRGPLEVADACELIRQAAVGLQFAHGKGVVHRDIKPGNLMVDRTLTVKVLDFGLARGGQTDEAGQPLTLETAILGTPEYMAPEQASGASKVDSRADLYALGCTLYLLLAARPPFTEEEEGNRLNILHAHCNKPVPSVRQRRPDVPPALASLLE